MIDYLKEMDELLDMEPDIDTVGNIVEGISQSNVAQIVETMIDNPRVKSKMKHIGLDLSDSVIYSGLSAALLPAITLFLDSQGERVSGLSSAKTSLKNAAKQKTEDVGESTEDAGNATWTPGDALWAKASNDMAKEITENCDTLKEALIILNRQLLTTSGMTASDIDRVKKAKSKVMRLY